MTLEGAIVVILDNANKILLLKRPENVKWSPLKWALPGGKLESGETPLAAAIRETKEETTLEVTDLIKVSEVLDKCVAAYYTRNYTGKVQLDFEHTDWAWVTRDDIENYDLAPGVLKLYDWVLQNG